MFISSYRNDFYKYSYNARKLRAYIWTEKRIAKDLRKEFIDRISREFAEADRNDEIDMELVDEEYRERLKLLIKDPDAYYKKYEADVEKKERIRGTRLYKVYKALRGK